MKVEPVWGRVLVFSSLWLTASVFAQPSKRVVILSPPSEKTRMHVLEEAVVSQSSELGAQVSVQALEEREVAPEDFLAVAESYRRRSRAVAVIWLEGGDVHVLAGDEERSNHVVRPLPSGGGDWETECDAVASVIRSVLSPWLASYGAPTPGAEVEAGSKAETETAAEPRGGQGPPPSPKSPADPPPSPVSSMSVRLHAVGVSGGYAPTIMSCRQPWLHGGWLGLDVRWLEYFRASIGGTIVPALRRQSYGLQRMPLRLEAEARRPLRSWSLGAALSYVLDIARVRGSELGGEANRFYHGLGVVAVVAHRPMPWMELRFFGGVDLYQAADRYVDRDGETIFEYGPVQGRLGIGLVFWLWGDEFSLFSSGKHPT